MTHYARIEAGQRVACIVSPNADDTLDTGRVLHIIRQTYTADLARVAWDRDPRDRDLYSTDILTPEEAA